MMSTSSLLTVASNKAAVWYSFAIVRVVPRVERGECVNVGVVLFVRERRYLAARIELDRARLLALAPHLDLDLVERHLATFLAISEGGCRRPALGSAGRRAVPLAGGPAQHDDPDRGRRRPDGRPGRRIGASAGRLCPPACLTNSTYAQ